MGSLNASGIPVVPKQQLRHTSYGRNLAVTLNQGQFVQNSAPQPIVRGIPAYARPSGLFGTQSSPAIESFLHLPRFVKHAESVDDTTIARILEQVPATTGNVLGNQQSEDHRGNRVVVQESIDDRILGRKKNTSVRPGGEI